MTTRRENLWAAIVGALSAVVTLAVAEVVALVLAPSASPLFAVGSFVIDVVPGWVKSTVIALFGTGDKIALFVALGILLALLAVAIGILEYRRPPFGVVGLVIVGGIATVAVTTRAEATALWAVPTVVGMLGGVLILRLAMMRLHTWVDSTRARGPERMAERRADLSRRGFVGLVAATAVGAVVAGAAARMVNAATNAVIAVREAIVLPKPATAAAAIPAGATLDIDGISPLFSSNDTFYRIDTALQVPAIDASTWKLRITGMVENEIEIGFDELLALPLIETAVTLTCVSNEVGGNLIGNAMWLGYPIRDLLARAKPLAGADVALSTSVDGWTATTPLDVLQDDGRDAILAVGMNGEPLPIEHGFPVRMVVPGLYGYVSATKWVTEIKVSTFATESAYWTDRGWSERGPIKTSSRIDVPTYGANVPAGKTAVAGVAWAQHTGITGVEVRVDGGSWTKAKLADPISKDTWRQWVYEWEATTGDHVLEVRATDAAGTTQSGTPVNVVPNGSEGWHTIDVTVS